MIPFNIWDKSLTSPLPISSTLIRNIEVSSNTILRFMQNMLPINLQRNSNTALSTPVENLLI